MKNKIRLFLLVLFFPMLSINLTSCKGDEPIIEEEIDTNEKERVILLYAVASNNLSNNFYYDKNEIIACADELDLRKNAVLLYSVLPGGKCQLQKLVKRNNEYEFSTIQDYPDTPLSVEAERISTVLRDVENLYPDAKKGLILWSHATGWIPWFAPQTSFGIKKKSFGYDSYEGVGYECNITTLAEAIPDNVFDFIWFDCCYMANIETIYQLRDKADKIIGYVTEIYADGMPYNKTMPLLLKKDADLEGAAYQLFTYYDRNHRAVTVSITDTAELDHLAYATSNVIKEGEAPRSLYNILNYSRLSNNPFYDMGGLMEHYTGVSDETMTEFRDALETAVVYKLASQFDFTGYHEILPSDYSGLSIHNYVDNGSAKEIFYTQLDWYKATRKE